MPSVSPEPCTHVLRSAADSAQVSAPLVINWHGCNAHLPLVDYHAEISKTLGAAANALVPAIGRALPAACGGAFLSARSAAWRVAADASHLLPSWEGL